MASEQRQTAAHSRSAVSVAVNLATAGATQARAAIGVRVPNADSPRSSPSARALISPALPLHGSSSCNRSQTLTTTLSNPKPTPIHTYSTCLAAELLVALAPIAAALRVPATAANKLPHSCVDMTTTPFSQVTKAA